MTVTTTRIERKLVSVFSFTLVLSASAAAQTQQKPEQLAQPSADACLTLIDSGKYAESW